MGIKFSLRDHCTEGQVGLSWAGTLRRVGLQDARKTQALFGRKQTADRGLREAKALGSKRREQCGETFDR